MKLNIDKNVHFIESLDHLVTIIFTSNHPNYDNSISDYGQGLRNSVFCIKLPPSSKAY